KSSFLETKKYKRLITDSYNNIPIYYFERSWFKNQIIVCQFNIAMKMKQKRLEEYYYNLLDIQVNEVNDKDIEYKLRTESQNWLVDDKGNEVSREEGEIKLKKSIKMYVGSEIEFEVLDSDAFETCIIEDINVSGPQ
ncbi:MAG: hypothetical protein Q7S39_11940, partial [Ignavibacteria bacterium]|nr:hypothetical protein [Ignavibacteria bacterium]